MKPKILKALNEAIKYTKKSEKPDVIRFLDYLSTLYLNTIVSANGTGEILNYIRANNQEEIMDFLYRVNSELLVIFGYSSVYDLYIVYMDSHDEFIKGYETSDAVYYDMVKSNPEHPIFLRGVCYILRLHIEQVKIGMDDDKQK